MALFRIILTFQQYGFGWTEEHAISFGGTARQAAYGSPAIVSDATNCRDDSVSLVSIDARELPALPTVGPTRRGFLRLVNANQNGPQAVADADLTQECALMRWTDQDGQQFHYFISGLKDDDIIRNPVTGATIYRNNLSRRLDEYHQSLVNWGLVSYKMKSAGLVGNQQPQPVQEVQGLGAANGVYTQIIAVAGAVLPAMGDQIIMRGVPNADLPNLKGKFRVKKVDVPSNSFLVRSRWRYGSTVVGGGNMTYAVVQMASSNAQGFQLGNATSHKRANPTNRSPGRRTAVSYRR